MKNFDLSIYKKTRVYFDFFNIYLKKQNITREEIFSILIINNSSYRRCRESEQKVGKQILKQLAEYFEFIIPNDIIIDELQEKINQIYHKMYYKIYDTYEEDQKYIDALLGQNILLLPIVKLIKLYLVVNSTKSVVDVKTEYKEMFEDVKSYLDMFTYELREIYEILNLFFGDEIVLNENWNQDYKNAMSYQIVASKCYFEKKYIEAIFFSKCSLEILLNDMNYKRIITVNRTIMGSYLYVGNYSECHKIAEKQILYLQSINYSDYELESAYMFEAVSLLGLEKYNEVEKMIEGYSKMNLTLLTCLFVALYQVNREKYIELYNENIEEFDSENKEYLFQLNKYLKNKDKNALSRLNNYSIMGGLIKILKNFKMSKNAKEI